MFHFRMSILAPRDWASRRQMSAPTSVNRFAQHLHLRNPPSYPVTDLDFEVQVLRGSGSLDEIPDLPPQYGWVFHPVIVDTLVSQVQSCFKSFPSVDENCWHTDFIETHNSQAFSSSFSALTNWRMINSFFVRLRSVIWVIISVPTFFGVDEW